MNLNSISLAMYRAGNAQFTMERLFFATDTGSWYKFTVPSSLTNADAYQSTTAIYPVIDDGRGVVNLLLRSQQISYASVWIPFNATATDNTTTAPDGTTTAGTLDITSSGGSIYQTVAVSPDTEYTFSFYAQAGTISSNRLAVYDATNASFISSDVVYSPGSGTFNRITETFTTPAGCTSIRVYPSRNGVGTGAGTVIIWGLMLNVGDTALDYQYTGPYLNGPAQPVGLLLAANRDGRGPVNQIYNQMAGGVAGSSGTMPTTWFTTTALTGLTRTLAFGEENGIKYIDITVSGTPSAAGNYDVGFAGNTQIAALTGQVWAESLYLKLQAGSLTGVSSMIVRYNEYTSGGAFVTGQDSSAFSTPTGADLDTQRQSKTATLNGGGTTAAVQPLFRIALTGAAVDFTLRIGEPQVERDAATAVQKNDIYLGGPGDHMGNSTSANRMTYALVPYGGVRNLLTNNMATGAVNGSPGTLPSGYFFNSLRGLTWAVSAVDTSAGTFRIRLSGTPTSSGGISLFLIGSLLKGVQGDTFSISSYVSVQGGDLTNIAAIGYLVDEYTSPSTYRTTTSSSAFTPDGTPVRIDRSITLANGSTDAFYPGIFVEVTNSLAVDVTLELTTPQVEKAAVASEVQKVTSIYDISESGLPQIPMLYGDGSSDFHTLGKQYFGLKQDGNGVVNGLLHTSRFQNPVWTASAATVTDCSVTGPSGNTDATTIADNVTNTSHGVSQVTTAFPSDEEITIQVKAKAGTLDWMRVEADDGSSNIIRCFFDINTGAVGTESVGGTGVVSDSGVIADSNGYSIYYLTGTPSTTNTGSLTIRIRTATADTVTSYAGSGGTILVADAQVNLGTIEDYQPNSYTLGGSLGTAGLFADPTQQWSVGGDCSTFLSTTGQTLCAKAGGTSGSMTLNVFYSSGASKLRVNCRGSETNSTVNVADGGVHVWLLTWDGSTLLLYVDNEAPVTITVGTAAEEAQNITWFARTESSPASRLKGYGLPLLMEARALATSEARQFMDYHCNRVGVSA